MEDCLFWEHCALGDRPRLCKTYGETYGGHTSIVYMMAQVGDSPRLKKTINGKHWGQMPG
ncbi:MAG: hypothetical protein MJ188_04625 [Treponema sp.]|nr:hypothetical protein [Treponema sp.]